MNNTHSLSHTKPKFIIDNEILSGAFAGSPLWVVVRVLGMVFIWLIYPSAKYCSTLLMIFEWFSIVAS